MKQQYGAYVLVTDPDKPEVIGGVINALSKQIEETREKRGPMSGLEWIIKELTLYDRMSTFDISDYEWDEDDPDDMDLKATLEKLQETEPENTGPVWSIGWKATFG